jgi:hypothetical protein
MKTNNFLKIQFIRRYYNFVLWEKNARGTAQLVSDQLYTLNEAIIIKQKIDDSMRFSKDGIDLAESNQFPGQIRIIIHLDNFVESTLFYQNLIVSFLNDTCIPTGYTIYCPFLAKFSTRWKLDEFGYISFTPKFCKFDEYGENKGGQEFTPFIIKTIQKMHIYGSDVSNIKNSLKVNNYVGIWMLLLF